MAQVYTQKKIRRGATVRCGTCGRVIEPGETYHKWSFNWGHEVGPSMYYACADHYPRRSQLTWPESKMRTVYEELEKAEDAVAVATDIEEINAAVQSAAESVREIADRYHETSEAMGAAGAPSQTTAQALVAAANELESWEAAIGTDEELRIEKEEWAAMLRERGLDPADYAIDSSLSRHNAFVAQNLDEGELELRVNVRLQESGVDTVTEAKKQALEELRNLELGA